MDDLYAHLGDLTPKLRENLATFEERARNNENVMLLIRDVPLDFTLHDITLGGWNRSEIDAFFDRFEMNQMRTRFGQLMKEGLLGDAGETSSPLSEATVAKKTATAATLKVAKSLDEVLASTTRPVVAFRHTRAAVLDAEKGLVALCDLDDAIDAFARVAPCGHDLKSLYRTAASDERVMLEPAMTRRSWRSCSTPTAAATTSPKSRNDSWVNPSSTRRRRSLIRRPVTRR